MKWEGQLEKIYGKGDLSGSRRVWKCGRSKRKDVSSVLYGEPNKVV